LTYRYLSNTVVSVQLNPTALAVTRTLAGLSQAALARNSGVSQGHISGIESGDKQASPEMLTKIANALGVPIAALITDPTPEQVAAAKAALSKKVPGTKVLTDRRKAS
jgi:transcriptional regulator with XRE-family HTH domain